MAIPNCEGERHIFIVGHEVCRCGKTWSGTLDPRETRIAGLVTKDTWPTIEVMFLLRDEISMHASCSKCRYYYLPVLISTDDWERLASSSSEARDAQREVAAFLAQVVNEDPCKCRSSSMGERQGLTGSIRYWFKRLISSV